MVHVPNRGVPLFAARWGLGSHFGRSLHKVSFYVVRISDRQSLGSPMASVHRRAGWWNADNVSGDGRRTCDGVLFRHLDEIAAVVDLSAGRRCRCVVVGRKKKTWPVMGASDALLR